MNFFENIIDHFSKMNGLEGAGTDYPVMLCIYLGIFLFSFVANGFNSLVSQPTLLPLPL